MNKSIKQLKKEFRYKCLGLAFLYVALTVILYFASVEEVYIFLLVITLGIVGLIAINIDYAKRAGKRLNFIVADLMDVQLLRDEVKEAYSRSGNSWKRLYMNKYVESTYYNLQGDYDNTLKAWDEMPAPNQKYLNSKMCGRTMILIRMGNLEDAEKSLQRIVEIEGSDNAMSASCNRVLGAYYTSIGNIEKARALLDRAMNSSKYNLEKMGLFFDLARLEEKESNIEKAIEHFKQAAAIGPMTWIGQEAARRAETLAADTPK